MLARTQDKGKDERSNGDVLSEILKSWNIANKNLWLKEFDMIEWANSISKDLKTA